MQSPEPTELRDYKDKVILEESGSKLDIQDFIKDSLGGTSINHEDAPYGDIGNKNDQNYNSTIIEKQQPIHLYTTNTLSTQKGQ